MENSVYMIPVMFAFIAICASAFLAFLYTRKGKHWLASL